MSDLVMPNEHEDDSIKHVRFKRVASKRLQRTLEDIQSLANCAKPASYSYTEEEVNYIFSEIERGISAARDAFAGKKRFSLTETDNGLCLAGLEEALAMFDETGWHGIAEAGNWKIAAGGYDMWFQVMYKGEVVLDCMAGKLESNYGLREDESKMLIEIVKNRLTIED